MLNLTQKERDILWDLVFNRLGDLRDRLELTEEEEILEELKEKITDDISIEEDIKNFNEKTREELKEEGVI